MKRSVLLLSLLIVALFAAPSGATTIDIGAHTLTFGIVEGITLIGTAELIVIDGGSTQGGISVGENAIFTMLGGHIEGNLVALGDKAMTIKGGTIGGDIMLDNGIPVLGDVYIYGSDFAIDGIPVAPGAYHQTGIFTGILENGDPLDNRISFSGANDVILVPEPATLILLTIGTICLRKRKSA